MVGVSRSQTISVAVAVVGCEPMTEENWFDILIKSFSSTKERTYAIPLAVDECCVFDGGSTGT